MVIWDFFVIGMLMFCHMEGRRIFFLEPTFAAVWLHDLTFVTFWRHMILYSLPASSPALIWADLGLERERGRDIWHADATNYPQYAQIHT